MIATQEEDFTARVKAITGGKGARVIFDPLECMTALLRLGWTLKKQVGSHRKLQRAGWSNFTFCFHDGEEVGPAALSKIGKDTGLRPEDL